MSFVRPFHGVRAIALLLGLTLVLGCQPAAPSPTAAPAKPAAEAKPTEAPKPAAPAATTAPAAPAAKPAASPAAAAPAPAAPAASPAAAPAAKPASGPVPGVPAKVEFMVHTDPGGGGDLLARETIEMLKAEKLIEGTWTVNNQAGGGGAKALAYLANQKGRNDVIFVSTNVMLATPLTSKEVKNSYTEYTPIAHLAQDGNIIAVQAESPYKTMKDFVDAAKAKPNQLNQSGGSLTSTDNLAREVIMKATGAQWNFLSFPGGGERIAALLGGNADLMITQPPEVAEQVKAGKLRVIGTLGDKRLAALPDVPTLAEQGFNVEIPTSHRGIMGPGGMPAAEVAAFEALFKRLTETESWKQYITRNSSVALFMPAAEFKAYLDKENTRLDSLLGELGMKAQ
jgi:putative tricarboxylic transport membrane protein